MAKDQTIAVFGGGVVGLCIAWQLQQYQNDTYKTFIYDRSGFPAYNASFIAGGMLAPYAEIEHMSEAWIEAGLAGIRQWKFISENLGAEIQFVQNGSLFISHPQDHYILERYKSHLAGVGCGEVLAHKALKFLEPLVAEQFSKALYLPDEAHLNPSLTMKALCGALENCITDHAEPDSLRENHAWVIDCRGMDARDQDFKLRGVKGEIVVVRNPEFTLARPVRLMHPRYPLYIVPRQDHHFMIGATMIEGEGEDYVSLRSGMELMSALYSLHPSFGESQIIEFSSGIRPAYPDNLPRITLDGNLIRCNGLFRHGYLLAPVMAECVDDIIAGKTNRFTSLFTGEENETDCKRQTAGL